MSAIALKRIFSTRVLSQQRVKQKREWATLLLTIKIMIFVLLITLFYLWSRLEVISLGYEIAKENKESSELIAENKRLRLEILTLKSPQRIEGIAVDKLSLVYPKGEQFIKIK